MLLKVVFTKESGGGFLIGRLLKADAEIAEQAMAEREGRYLPLARPSKKPPGKIIRGEEAAEAERAAFEREEAEIAKEAIPTKEEEKFLDNAPAQHTQLTFARHAVLWLHPRGRFSRPGQHGQIQRQ